MTSAFLSSTSKDLSEYRDAAYEAIEGLDDYHCVRMEDFGARARLADDFCRAKVVECDLFVGLAGHCYGSCPEGSEQSYTVREYEAAVNKPRLMFLAREGFATPTGEPEPDDKQQKQREFRQRVSGELIRDTFTSPHDLAWRVLRAIYNCEAARSGAALIPLPPQPYFAHPYPLQEHFTGRLEEREMLTQWLTSGDQAVFALVAIGGMGKSALTWAWLQRDVLGFPLPDQGGPPEPASSAAAEGPPEAPSFGAEVGPSHIPEDLRPDGFLWWSFYEREAKFTAFLREAIIYASGGQIDPDSIQSDHEKLTTLVGLLQQRRILLVLDGFERELRAYASLNAAYQGDAIREDPEGNFRACVDPRAAEFLRSVASVPMQSRVLITSRLFPRELDGLAGCQREDLESLAPADAITFFQAQGVKGTRAEIQEACEPYGYHPLALRLLAGLIIGDKRRRCDVQVAKRYPVLPKLKGKEQHHILQVAYDTLDRRKRALLSRIAAFRSPMTYEALCVLNPYKGEERFDAALDELMDRGLLFYDEGQSRYDLHPIVRRHAYDRLRDKEGVHTRLRDYFEAIPAPDEDEVQSVEDLAAVIELYHHTVRAGRYDDAFRLFRDRLHNALYYRLGGYQTCIELLRALFPGGEENPPRLKDESDQAWTLTALANSYGQTGQPRRAVPLFEMQTAIREKQGDKQDIAIGLENLATQQLIIGQLAPAEENLQRDIELAEEIEDEFYQATGHQELGRLLGYRGAFDEAAEELETALRLFEGLRHPQLIGVTWAYRALRALLMGDAEAALHAARQALVFWKKDAEEDYPVERHLVRVNWLLGWSLVALAAEQPGRREEHLAEAETHLTEALTRCRTINMVDHEPDILLAHARWHHLKGNTDHARAFADEALATADRCEYRLKQAEIHNFLVKLDMEAGDNDAARQHAEIAKERAECDGLPDHYYKVAYEEAERQELEARS